MLVVSGRRGDGERGCRKGRAEEAVIVCIHPHPEKEVQNGGERLGTRMRLVIQAASWQLIANQTSN